jgi:hypothetical protein
MSIDDDLRAALIRRANRATLDAGRAWRRIEAQLDGSHRPDAMAPGRRLAIVLAALAIAAAPLTLVVIEFRDGTPAASGASHSSAASTRPRASVRQTFEAFVPPTRSTDGSVVLPVTFPDGSTAELAYPPSLDLAGLGVRPYWAGCGGDFGFFHYDPYGSLYEGPPMQTWTGADGQAVGLWPGVQGTGPLNHLIWHFGDWTVEKYEYRDHGSSPEELAACAEGLQATVTPDGWIVLDGPAAIGLPRGAGPPGGAELEFGGLQPRRFVLMWPGPCQDVGGSTVIGGVSVDLSKDFASWCDPGGNMLIHVYFEPGSTFFRDVFDGLTVQRVTLATPTR